MVHQSLVKLGQLVHCLVTYERLPHKQDKIRGVHSNQLGEERRGEKGEDRKGGGGEEGRGREGEEGKERIGGEEEEGGRGSQPC